MSITRIENIIIVMYSIKVITGHKVMIIIYGDEVEIPQHQIECEWIEIGSDHVQHDIISHQD